MSVGTAAAWRFFSAQEAAADPEDVGGALDADGCCTICNAVPPALCAALAATVDCALDRLLQRDKQPAEDEQSDALEVGLLGNVRCRENRYDFKLPMSREVCDAIVALVASIGGALECQVFAKGHLVELSCLVTDPGAERQPLHPDTPIQGNDCAGLLTAFVALQPISEQMGPTILCPGTHHARQAHVALAELSVQARADTGTIERFGGVAAACDVGAAVLMDSRLLHCGGANLLSDLGGSRRRLLYTTWQMPGNAPGGSTYSIRSNLQGRLRLEDFQLAPGIPAHSGRLGAFLAVSADDSESSAAAVHDHG